MISFSKAPDTPQKTVSGSSGHDQVIFYQADVKIIIFEAKWIFYQWALSLGNILIGLVY